MAARDHPRDTAGRTAVLAAAAPPAAAGSATFILAAVALAAASAAPARLGAQTLTGRVLDEYTDAPVPGALVVLLDQDGDRALQVESDSLGRYLIRVPRPAAFTLAASRLGYEEGRTPLLDLSFEGTRTLDLVVTPRPVALAGFEVRVSAEEELERALRHFGVAPGQLSSSRIVTAEEIEAVETARDFGDVLNRQNIAGLRVIRDPRSDTLTCIQVRVRSGCAAIVIDGVVAPLPRAAVLPGEAWESMVILKPHEAALLFGTGADGEGAVLLFSRGRAWR